MRLPEHPTTAFPSLRGAQRRGNPGQRASPCRTPDCRAANAARNDGRWSRAWARKIIGQAAAATLLSAAAHAQALRPPVSPACISSPFGWRHAIGPHAPAAFHNGVDLPAPAGALVHAAADGNVLRVKRQGLGGVTIHLGHPGGVTTLYAHLGNLVPAIAEGKRAVTAGEPLGHVARTGVTYGAHVFFAVLHGTEAVDPEPLLGVPRCR